MTEQPKTSFREPQPLAKRPIRLLLINPRFPESFWSFRWSVDKVLRDKRTINPPLGLATLAALCPADWQVTIVDEHVDSVPVDPEVDIVGVCGMAVQFQRQSELLSYYRSRGYYVVAGGSFASLCPDRYPALADTVVAGEAEYIWPQFCRDFELGTPRQLYQETGAVDLTDSPTPRFELLQLDRYTTASLQFSRGCPYRCEFCDIIVMFGRRPRTKRLEQIGKELDRLRSLDVHNVFFVDDNLIGNRPKAKELLRYLADYQRRHDHAFQFGTQASLNLAQDDELLRLLREADFGWVFIGIESPDEASLRETKKTQNTGQNILSSVRKIYGHGIDVLAGFIIGFDNDTLATFDRQYRFIMASGIQVAMVGLLAALPRTPLYERLKREGRLFEDVDHVDNTKPATNFAPKSMDYDAMVQGYKRLHQRLSGDRDIAKRIRNKTRYLGKPVHQGKYFLGQKLAILSKLFAHGLLPGGPVRVLRFLGTLATCTPRAWPQVVSDWITGLATQHYVKRYFAVDASRERRVTQTTLELLRRTYATYLQRGELEVSLADSATRLMVTLRGAIEPRFYRHAVRRFEKLLRTTAGTLTLRIEEFSENQLDHNLHQLLQRLSRYGDRVSLQLDHKIRPLLKMDLSKFHLVLDVGLAPASATG